LGLSKVLTACAAKGICLAQTGPTLTAKVDKLPTKIQIKKHYSLVLLSYTISIFR
jgi:hypothetical protein